MTHTPDCPELQDDGDRGDEASSFVDPEDEVPGASGSLDRPPGPEGATAGTSSSGRWASNGTPLVDYGDEEGEEGGDASGQGPGSGQQQSRDLFGNGSINKRGSDDGSNSSSSILHGDHAASKRVKTDLPNAVHVQPA